MSRREPEPPRCIPLLRYTNRRGRSISAVSTLSNAVDPGWVATKMGGASAPDDFEEGYLTQAWLAVSDDHPCGLRTRRHAFSPVPVFRTSCSHLPRRQAPVAERPSARRSC